MTSTNKYRLSQWEKSDKVLMEDFNSDNQKIEDALAGLAASKAEQSQLDTLSALVNSTLPGVPKIAAGTYVGTGKYGEGNPTTLPLLFRPKLAIVTGNNATAVFLEGQEKVLLSSGACVAYLMVTWEDAALTWYVTDAARGSTNLGTTASYQLNGKDSTYRYFIIG